MDTIDSRQADSPEPAEKAADQRDRKLLRLLEVTRELDKVRAESQAEDQDEDEEDDEEEDDEEEDEGGEEQEGGVCLIRNRVVGRFQRPVRWCVMSADSSGPCVVIMINWSDVRPKPSPKPEDAAS